MKIILNHSNLLTFETNEHYEENHISSVLNDIFEKIDDNNLAIFQICFKEYDKVFDFPDFKYDFSSIFYELQGLFKFVDNREKGQFELFFYELNRRVIFYIDNDEYLFFKIEISNENKFVAMSDRITLKKANLIILQIILNFKFILSTKFPKAYEFIYQETKDL